MRRSLSRGDRQPEWFRLTRAGIFASVCVWLSWFGHDLMTDSPAPWWLPALALPMLTPVAYLLAAERRSVVTIVIAVEAAQLVLHEAFSAVAPARVAAQPVFDPMCGGGHPVAITDAMSTTGMHHGGGAGMLLAHLAAGVVAGLWLNLAERVSWQVLRTVATATTAWLRRTIRAVRLIVPALPRPRWTPLQHVAWSIRREAIGRAVFGRGPPRHSLFSTLSLA